MLTRHSASAVPHVATMQHGAALIALRLTVLCDPVNLSACVCGATLVCVLINGQVSHASLSGLTGHNCCCPVLHCRLLPRALHQPALRR